jgi:hypothetical protein
MGNDAHDYLNSPSLRRDDVKWSVYLDELVLGDNDQH